MVRHKTIFDNRNIWRSELLIKYLEALNEHRDINMTLKLTPGKLRRVGEHRALNTCRIVRGVSLILEKPEQITLKEVEQGKKRGDYPYLLKEASFSQDDLPREKLDTPKGRRELVYDTLISLLDMSVPRLVAVNFADYSTHTVDLMEHDPNRGMIYTPFLKFVFDFPVYLAHKLNQNR